MRKVVVLLACTSLLFEACGLLMTPAVSNVGTLTGSVAPAATGYLSTQSAVELNQATRNLDAAQAEQTREQVRAAELARAQTEKERMVTAGILREMANWEHDPLLDDVALWTEAGGDPNFAFQYALKRVEQDEKSATKSGRSTDGTSDRESAQ